MLEYLRPLLFVNRFSLSPCADSGSFICPPSTIKPGMDVILMTAKRIETGTADGDALGFSEDLFSGWLEFRHDHQLYLHYIISRHRNEGNTQALLRQWLSDGYDVRVVMPRPIMQHILRKLCFVPSQEYFPDQYEDRVEVWCRPDVVHYFPSSSQQAGKAGFG
jgi:hypothetical protein